MSTETLAPSPSSLERYIGAIDRCDDGVLTGWVVDDRNSEEPVELVVVVDGRPVLRTLADEMRPDLECIGYAGAHGFYIVLDGPWCDDRLHRMALCVPGEDRPVGWHVFDVRLPDRSDGRQHVRGHIDLVDGLTVKGWACRWSGASAGSGSVELEARDEDGNVLADAVACQPRPDLEVAGFGSANHGFTLTLPTSLLTGGGERVITIFDRSSGRPISSPLPIAPKLALLLAGDPAPSVEPQNTRLCDGFQSLTELVACACGLGSPAPRGPAVDPFAGRRIAVLADGNASLQRLPEAFAQARAVDVLAMDVSPETEALQHLWPAWHEAMVRVRSIHSTIPKYSPADDACARAAADITHVISDSMRREAEQESVYADFVELFGDLIVEQMESYLYSEVCRKLAAAEALLEDADIVCLVVSERKTWMPVLDLLLQRLSSDEVFLHVPAPDVLTPSVNRIVQMMRRHFRLEEDRVPSGEDNLITHLDLAIETAGKLIAAKMKQNHEVLPDCSGEVEIFLQMEGSYAHAFVDGIGELLRNVLDHRDVRISYVEREPGKAASNLSLVRQTIGMTGHTLHAQACPDVSQELAPAVSRLQRALADFVAGRRLAWFQGIDCSEPVAAHIRGAMGSRILAVLQAAHHFALRFAESRPHRFFAYPGAETIARAALRCARHAGIPTADCQMIFVAEDPRSIFHWRREADTLFVLDSTFATMFHQYMNWPMEALKVVGSIRIDSLLKPNRGAVQAKVRSLFPTVRPDHKIILLAMQPYAEQEMTSMLDAMCQVAEVRSDVVLVIRAHPIDTPVVRSRYLNRCGRRIGSHRALDGFGLDLGKSIAAADLVVSLSSNVLLEAACLGSDCLIAAMSPFSLPPTLDLGVWGLGSCGRTEDDLATTAEEILFDPEAAAATRQRREAFFQSNPQYRDLSSAARIAEHLVR